MVDRLETAEIRIGVFGSATFCSYKKRLADNGAFSQNFSVFVSTVKSCVG